MTAGGATTGPAAAGTPPGWTAVVPVKNLPVAKSRLQLPGAGRAELALAMALDVLRVLAGVPTVRRVLVVTDDGRVASELGALPALAGLRADVLADTPHDGLSAAVAHGVRAARARWTDGVLVLAADVPAVRAGDLTAVLAQCAAGGVVADTDGIGTVLLAAAPGFALTPAYEGASYAAHRAGGAADLTPFAAETLRRDVDTVADLRQAIELGVGPETARVLASTVHLGM